MANIQWSEFQKEYLRRNCGSLKDIEIARAIGKSVDSVRKMRQKMGLKKVAGRGRCQLISNAEENRLTGNDDSDTKVDATK